MFGIAVAAFCAGLIVGVIKSVMIKAEVAELKADLEKSKGKAFGEIKDFKNEVREKIADKFDAIEKKVRG